MWPWSTWKGWSQDSGALAWGTHCALGPGPPYSAGEEDLCPQICSAIASWGKLWSGCWAIFVAPSTVGRAFHYVHGQAVAKEELSKTCSPAPPPEGPIGTVTAAQKGQLWGTQAKPLTILAIGRNEWGLAERVSQAKVSAQHGPFYTCVEGALRLGVWPLRVLGRLGSVLICLWDTLTTLQGGLQHPPPPHCLLQPLGCFAHRPSPLLLLILCSELPGTRICPCLPCLMWGSFPA